MWTKICGVRDEATAERIAELQPSAIGLNFYGRSRRSVTLDHAVRIASALPTEIARIGLFVNHSVPEVLAHVQSCGLGAVQLHGDEPPEFLAELKSALPSLRILRALRVSDDDENGLDAADRYLEDCRRLQADPWAVLLDAYLPGQYGGTGRTLRWDRIAGHNKRVDWPRLILSGGLNPQNVGRAIQTVRPFGVDVASGVEDDTGQQSLEQIRQFLAAARQLDGTPDGVDSTGRPTDG